MERQRAEQATQKAAIRAKQKDKTIDFISFCFAQAEPETID